MKDRDHETKTPDEGPAFDWREIACATEEPRSTGKSVLGAVMGNLHLEDLFLR
jgi:hypothetical protein